MRTSLVVLMVCPLVACGDEAVVPGLPPGPGEATVLLADWDAGLGTGENAYSDGGVFATWGSGGGFMEVRSTAADQKGFSTPNYLRVNATGGGWVDMISRRWETPQVGDTIRATWEIAWVTTVSGQTTHGFYFDDDFGGTNWGPNTLGLSIEDSGDQWQFGVWVGPSANPGPGPLRVPERFSLTKGERYDVALWYVRTGADTFRAGFAVGQGGLVLYESGDFCDYDWYSGDRCLDTLEFSLSGAGAQGMRGFRIGNNGLDNPFTGPIVEVANLRVDLVRP